MNRRQYAVRFRENIADISVKHDADKAGNKKRNYAESFGERDYEMERYGQEIGAEFFTHNIGHVVLQETK
jgi:hypothetical protein